MSPMEILNFIISAGITLTTYQKDFSTSRKDGNKMGEVPSTLRIHT